MAISPPASTPESQRPGQTSAFRLVEKRYKSRLPPAGAVLTHTELRKQRRQGSSWRPALSDVWDLRGLLPAGAPGAEERANGEWGEAQLAGVECFEVGRGGIKAWAVKDIPGLVVLPAYLAPDEQRRLIGSCLADYTQPPNRTNLDQHFVLPEPPATLWSLYSAAASARAKSNAAPKAVEEAIIHPRYASLTPDEAKNYDRMPSGRTLVQNTEGERLTSEEVARTGSHRPEPSASARPTGVTQLLKELRWTNIGLFYDWSSKNYNFRHHIPFPEALGAQLSHIVKSEIDWASVYQNVLPDQGRGSVKWQDWEGDYENDAGIINAYQTHDSLMAHVDRSELDPHRPLISVSLGLSAIFLLGGTTRDESPVPLLLRSGDVIVLSGPSRRYYHGIPRVLDGTLPPHFAETRAAGDDSSWDPMMADYLRTTRININARQVFPPGFDPASLFAPQTASPDEMYSAKRP